MSDEITKDRFENRRKMAWLSHHYFSVASGLMIVAGVFSEEARNGIIAMWVPIAFFLGLWASVVAGYMASAYSTDQTELKNYKE